CGGGEGDLPPAAGAGVGPAERPEALQRRLVAGRARALEVRCAGAGAIGALVPVEPEPLEVAADLVRGTGDGPREVDVLDPQDDPPAVRAGVEPRREHGPGDTEVDAPGGARGEPADVAGGASLHLRSPPGPPRGTSPRRRRPGATPRGAPGRAAPRPTGCPP